jgi:hypothetical protein
LSSSNQLSYRGELSSSNQLSYRGELSSSNQLSYRETVVELQPTELQRDSCRALTNWATERQLSSCNYRFSCIYRFSGVLVMIRWTWKAYKSRILYSKSANKPSISCVRTACLKFETSC